MSHTNQIVWDLDKFRMQLNFWTGYNQFLTFDLVDLIAYPFLELEESQLVFEHFFRRVYVFPQPKNTV